MFNVLVLYLAFSVLLYSSMTVATLTPFRLVKHFDLQEITLFMTGNDHLGYALAIVDNERLLRQVDQQNTDFTAIISVNRSRRIQHRDPLL